MYDSIAAARKLRREDDEIDDREEVEFGQNVGDGVVNSLADHVIDNAADRGAKMAFADDNGWSGCQSTPSECSSANAPAADLLWCHFRDLSDGKTCPKSSSTFCDDRPASPVSIASMSSRYSVCSHGSCSQGSVDDADNEESNGRCVEEDSANPADESAESLVSEDGNRVKNAKSSPVQQRTSYTTASQYSEDSGIYSNLIRSESLHERSWCCSDGEDFTYTNRVILEILETELVYVNDLHQIITGYLDEWRNDGNCTLSREQIHDLFNNIEEIYNFNRCFLWELEQCGLDPVKIARCFVENNANFSIYAAYCTNYPRSIIILTELMRQERTAHLFRERQIRLHHTLPLGSYLLKPVQRILKYHLLLQNMVKHTPPDAVGYNDITVALSTMTGIAHHINTMKRRHEHAVRVQEVQSLLTGWQGPDLTTFGELYAEGSFRISGAKAFRHVFLFEHMLLVTKKKEAGILNYKTHILCSNLMLVECIPKEQLSFQIIPFDNPRMQFSIHARSLEEKRHWTLELKRVILENYNVNIPSHARQLVMELGQIQHSDNVCVEKISSTKRQISTPEYLERRKVDREKKGTMKSRLLPLFRKLDSLQNHRMRSKLKKNQFLSEGSIFSDTSVNSDESYSNDEGLQNLSKTTEDLSQTCDEMTRTLADLSKSSVCSSLISTTSRTSGEDVVLEVCADSNVDEKERRNSYQQKEKLIEEIIGQLLIASQKFQKAIKDHEMSVRAKQSSAQRRYSVSDCSLPEELLDEDTDDELEGGSLLKYSKESAFPVASVVDTSSESLSASLNVLVPTPPTVWLKQQAQHLASPHKKADSLPRTFQASASAEEEWRANRPKTIASDKPTQMKGTGENECCEMRINAFRSLRNKKPETTVSVASSLNSTLITTTAVAAMVHPECKFYRTSVTRMTLKRMMRSLSVKLSRRGKGDRFYKVAQQSRRHSEKYVKTEDLDCAISTMSDVSGDVDLAVTQRVVYRQGSADLGARIANGKEIPDYADPKVLFPTITPSKKAAALLGIRAYSNVSASCVNLEQAPTVRVNSANEQTVAQSSASGEGCRELRTDSDCSADSFYERQFEEAECEFENAIRETSILSDGGDTAAADEDDVRESFRRYSQVSVNISVHKLIKIPPPVTSAICKASEERATTAPKIRTSLTTTTKSKRRFVMASGESSIPTRGWVKQVVEKFQSTDAD